MEIDPTVPPYTFVQWDGKVVREIEQVRFKPGVDPATVAFETGYDKAALASWEIFKRLRDCRRHPQGTCASRSRLPTPQASGYLYVSGPARETYFEVYERALKAALANIVKAIPAPISRSSGTSARKCWPSRTTSRTGRPHYKKQTFDMLGRLGDAVPAGVEMGYHLCYGSPRDEHLVQPKDAAILVEMLNGIVAATKRRIDFLHIPVPKDRTDDAFYAPLKDFKRPAGHQALSRPAAPRRRRGRQGARRRGEGAMSRFRPLGRVRLGPHRARAAARSAERSSCCCGGTLMVERVLVVGPKDTISMVDDLAPKGFEIVKALHNSPEMKAALPGTDLLRGLRAAIRERRSSSRTRPS